MLAGLVGTYFSMEMWSFPLVPFNKNDAVVELVAWIPDKNVSIMGSFALSVTAVSEKIVGDIRKCAALIKKRRVKYTELVT